MSLLRGFGGGAIGVSGFGGTALLPRAIESSEAAVGLDAETLQALIEGGGDFGLGTDAEALAVFLLGFETGAGTEDEILQRIYLGLRKAIFEKDLQQMALVDRGLHEVSPAPLVD